MRKILGGLLIGVMIFAVSAMAANKPLTDQQLDAITAGQSVTIDMHQTQGAATVTATNTQTGTVNIAGFKAVNVQKQAQAGVLVVVVVPFSTDAGVKH